MINLDNIILATITLFIVVDVIGTIPAIINVSKGKNISYYKISFSCFILGTIFALFGNNFLYIFGVSQEAFTLAGGIVLFILSIEMITDRDIFKSQHTEENNSLIFPIAFPLLFGAGTLTSTLTLVHQYGKLNTIIALFLNTIIIYFILKYIKWIENNINSEILFLMKKIFGLFILAISLKLIISSFFLLRNL